MVADGMESKGNHTNSTAPINTDKWQFAPLFLVILGLHHCTTSKRRV